MPSFDAVSRSVDFELASRDLERKFVVESVSETEYGRSSTDKDDVLQQDGSMIRVDRKDAIVDEVGKTSELIQGVCSRC